ncbi:hypothetical protein PW89_23850 [Salmonella enterica subsp. enterica serovar Hadar]|nr:hypothetical protein [Salmonella enterica subsp. enterica serovar Hadar]
MVGKGDQGGGVAAVPIDAPDDVVDVVPAPDGGKDGKGEAVEPTLWYPVEGQGAVLAVSPLSWATALLPLRQDDGDRRHASRLVLHVFWYPDVLVRPGYAAGLLCRAVSACRAGDGDRAAALPLHGGFPDDEGGCPAAGADRRCPDRVVWQGCVPVLVSGVTGGLYGQHLADGGDAEGCRPWLASWACERDLSVVPVAAVPAQGLAVLGAVVHETVPAGGCDRAWSAIVEPCARVGSHGADDGFALVDAVPDLPAIADADQERRNERGRAAGSAACIGSFSGFPLAVPAGYAQRRSGFVWPDEAVGCSAATGAEVAGIRQGDRRGVIVLRDARPQHQTGGAPAAFEVWVVDALVLMALLVHLTASIDAKGTASRAGDEKDTGHDVGEPLRSAYALQCLG